MEHSDDSMRLLIQTYGEEKARRFAEEYKRRGFATPISPVESPSRVRPETRKYHALPAIVGGFILLMIPLILASKSLPVAAAIAFVAWLISSLAYAAYVAYVFKHRVPLGPVVLAPLDEPSTTFAPSSWREAEHDVCRWLKTIGEADATVGQGRQDGGVDVESSRFVVQVKDWRSNVSGPAIRQIFGVAAARGKSAVVVASGYTQDAFRFAQQAGVALFTYQSGAIQPVNHHARQI